MLPKYTACQNLCLKNQLTIKISRYQVVTSWILKIKFWRSMLFKPDGMKFYRMTKTQNWWQCRGITKSSFGIIFIFCGFWMCEIFNSCETFIISLSNNNRIDENNFHISISFAHFLDQNPIRKLVIVESHFSLTCGQLVTILAANIRNMVIAYKR